MQPPNAIGASSAALLLEAFEAYPFDRKGFPGSIQVGFNYPPDGNDFHPLAYIYMGGNWAYPFSALSKVLGPDAVKEFHADANEYARSYRHDQPDKPSATGQAKEVAKTTHAVEPSIGHLNSDHHVDRC
jgi:hypothetical protein